MKWYRVMLVVPVEVEAESPEEAIDVAVDAFGSELDAEGIDALHDLHQTTVADVYAVPPGSEVMLDV